MQRLLFSPRFVSQLSKTTASSTTTSPLFANVYSHFVTNSNPISRHQLSSLVLHSWRANSTQLVRRFESVPQFEGSIKTLAGLGVLFRSTQWPSRSSQFSPSFQSYRRGWRSWFQRLTTDDVVFGLILANVAVFFLWRIADRDFMYKNFTISVDNIRSGRVHTLITSAFSHIDVGHIMSNMVGLYFFGISTGRNFGPEFLLGLYFSGAVVGSVFYLVHHAFLAQMLKEQRTWNMDPSRVPGLGASGAVNAIMLLNIFMFPKATLYFDFIIPVPAILLGIFLIGKDVLRIIEGDPQVSGAAHLGGATVAALTWLRVRRRRF
ncbi:hypothetical protein Dimus_024033 [Dionaea muscipula]